MSVIREYFESREKAFGPNVLTHFMLTEGRQYPIGPDTFKGHRGAPKECYANAAHLAMWNNSLTYCEGMVQTIVPIDHAWCVDADGFVVDFHPLQRWARRRNPQLLGRAVQDRLPEARPPSEPSSTACSTTSTLASQRRNCSSLALRLASNG